MPLYMDIHRDLEVDLDAVSAAHERDLEVQDKHGVDIQRYWVDPEDGTVFCLFEAPSKAAGEAVHQEAHGLIADEIFEVTEGA